MHPQIRSRLGFVFQNLEQNLGFVSFRLGAHDNAIAVTGSEAKLGPLSEKLQARLNEGITNVTARIQSAIGQTPPPSSQ